MKSRIYTVAIFLFFVITCSKVCGQTSGGLPDTIYVSDGAEIQINFPSRVWNVTFGFGVLNPQYNTPLGTNYITITATIQNSKPDIITIKEGKKQPGDPHSFIIAYKQFIDKSTYDFSNRELLNRHDKEFAARKSSPFVKPPIQSVQTVQTKPEEKKYNQDVTVDNSANAYYKLISDGDADIKSGALDEAKKKFEKANKNKPDEQYPIAQLLVIKQKMDAEYFRLISEGIQLNNQKNYSKAKEKFEQAKKVRPDDSYAAQQIEKIDKQIRDEQIQKEQLDRYNIYLSFMNTGDNAFNKNNLVEAKKYYTQALSIKPGDLKAESQINKINVTESQQKVYAELQNNYNTAFGLAEMLFSKGDLENAKLQYEKANTYIKNPEISDRIKEINKRIHDKEVQALSEKGRMEKEVRDEERYKNIIQKADNEFNNDKYIEAKKSYALAAAIKPEESYPNEMLLKTESKINDIDQQKKLKKEGDEADMQNNKLYNSAINRGKKFYQKGDLNNALEAYTDANNLKPSEDEPVRQLSIINKQLENIKTENETNEKYDMKISTADSLFLYADKEQTADAFKSALASYTEAYQIIPSDYYVATRIKYIQSEITRIEKTLAKANEKRRNEEWDSTYNALKHEGWEGWREKRYEDALKALKQCLSMQYDKDIADMVERLELAVSKDKTSNEVLISNPTKTKEVVNDNKHKQKEKIENVNTPIEKNPPVKKETIPEITEKIPAKDTVLNKNEKSEKTESEKVVPKQGDKQTNKTYIQQTKAIPYEMAELHNKYPDINFAILPSEMRMNAADDSKENYPECIKLLAENPELNLFVSNNNINLICQGISFKGLNVYIKFLIQNDNNSDFLTGTMKLNWNKLSGDNVPLLPGYIYPTTYLPIILSGNEAYIIFVSRAYNISNQEKLTFELNDRLKKIKLQVSIPGVIYNQERNK